MKPKPNHQFLLCNFVHVACSMITVTTSTLAGSSLRADEDPVHSRDVQGGGEQHPNV